MIFHQPSAWFLVLLLAVPFVAWQLLRRKRRGAIAFSSTAACEGLRPSLKQRLSWVPPALRIASIVLLIVALARPQEGRRETSIDAEGIAIQMVVDRSGSMRAMDFEIEGKPVDRLTAVRDVASRFVDGDDDLQGRDSDLVGLIGFAGFADSLTPLTLDHGYVTTALNDTHIVTDREEDGTALGDGLALAVEKLSSLELSQTSDDGDGDGVKSKVVILLTDSENNAGDIDPVAAAELAATTGVKVYTIGVGTRGRAPVPVVDPFSGRETIQWAEVSIDEDTLKKIAEVTDGKYFRATNTESLKQIYAEIDELEKSRVEEKQYVDYRELAVEPLHAGLLTVPPLVLLAFLLLSLQAMLQHSVFRRIP